METALGRIELGLETLNSPTRRLSSFSSFPSRRSHLDSASYRSLVRIFSHCLDRSLTPPPSPPKVSVTTSSLKDPTPTAVGANASPNVEASSEMEVVGDLRADCAAARATAAELVGTDLDDLDPNDENEMEASGSSKMLSIFMADYGRLIDTPKGELLSDGQAGPDEIADIGLMTTTKLVHGADEGIFCPLGWVCGHFIENLSEERVHTASKELGDPVSCEPVEDIVVLEKPILVEAENVSSRVVEEKGEVTQGQSDVHSNSLLDSLGLINLEGDQASVLAHQTDDEDIEEGEIPDDFQNLEDLVDTVDEEVALDDKKKEGPRGDDFNEVTSTMIVPHKKEVCKHGAGDSLFIEERKGAYVDYEVSLHDAWEEDSKDTSTKSNRKVMKSKEKKKHGPLTEERKAKKKIAKKRKRAQKNREQGVKKLRLHPVAKPKEVKYCNFYLMGRCQQGDLCKFSHDTTPLTKSMPCKYFACNSCLKGDDCPYDHELSKYPCHNYISTGSCNRGDSCKFSHKIPNTDASSQSLAVSKVDHYLTSEQPKLGNLPFRMHASPSGSFPCDGKSKGTPPQMQKPLKEVNQVPKGLRFLSFGTAQTDGTNKVNNNLSVKQPGYVRAYNQQKQDNLLVHGHRSPSNVLGNSFPPLKSLMSSRPVLDVASSGFTIKNSGSLSNMIKGSSANSLGETLTHEVSEATKILEEFLFSGTG